MANSRSPVPLYHQVFSVLRQRLVDGTYEVGDRLKTEDEYAAEFDVSRATIRQAVGELVLQGLVTRKQGRGTFVAGELSHPISQRSRGSLADLIDEVKHTDIVKIDVELRAPYPQRIAQILRMESPAGMVIRRTRGVPGKPPHSYTVTHLASAAAELVTEEELRAEPLMVLLLKKGIAIARAQQTIRGQLADSEVCSSLGIEFGAPVLFAERLVLDAADNPVEFIQSWYNSELYELTVTLELTELEGRLATQQIS